MGHVTFHSRVHALVNAAQGVSFSATLVRATLIMPVLMHKQGKAVSMRVAATCTVTCDLQVRWAASLLLQPVAVPDAYRVQHVH